MRLWSVFERRFANKEGILDRGEAMKDEMIGYY